MANISARERAHEMRRSGKSLNEITQRLSVPKSTVRYWCRNISLSKEQLEHLHIRQQRGGVLAAEKMRARRLDIIKRLETEGLAEIGFISQRDLFIAGIALYWAEGYRKGDGEFGFTNSDPAMIQGMISWLTAACGISKKDMHVRICINEIHKYRIVEITKFWKRITGLSTQQFSNPTFIKNTSRQIYSNKESYFGTLRVKVRSSTNFKRKILGWIKGLKSGMSYNYVRKA